MPSISRTTILGRLAALVLAQRPDSPPTSAELSASLDEARALLPAIREERSAAQAKRADHLLAGDAGALQEAEARIAELTSEIERVELLLERLPTRIREASEAEEQLARAARVQDLRKLRARGEQLLARYEEISAELVPLVAELAKIDMELAAARRREPDLPEHPTPPLADRNLAVESLATAIVLPPVRKGGPSWSGSSPTVEFRDRSEMVNRVRALDEERRSQRGRRAESFGVPTITVTKEDGSTETRPAPPVSRLS